MTSFAQSNLRAALELAAAGIPIFPALISQSEQPGKLDKKPAISGWQVAASTDPNQIRAWWAQIPDAVPAIELGRAGLVVLDLDRHPGQPDGVGAFKTLLNGHDRPKTATTHTAGDGFHSFYAQPTGEPFGNSRGDLPAGIDVRGVGGWVVAPGAVTLWGSWRSVGEITLPAGYRHLPELPDWIGQILRPPRRADAPPHRPSGSREEKYARAALDNGAAKVGATAAGQRNHELNIAAFCLGTMIARGWIGRGTVEGCLLDAAAACGLIADDGDHGARATIKSGIEAGLKQPHTDLENREQPRPTPRSNDGTQAGGEWLQPKPLPEGLAPVAAFDLDFMPGVLKPWIGDISDRMQCPPDYVGVSAITALGAVIGRRIGIKPQMQTDWIEVPNLWGAFIGRPGMLKSPAMMEALKPLHRLEKEAQKSNELARKAYEAGLSIYKLEKQVKISLEKERLKEAKNKKIDAGLDLGEEPQEPAAIRYRTNDTSYEKLGEILVANPTGIVIERDELVSLLQHLDREEQAVARGFYLSGWSGRQPNSFDRIGRGHLHIDAVCISVLGTTQPTRIAEYVRRANAGGAGGDGLIQRFSLLAWPDTCPDWEDVDEYPDSKARETAWSTFDRLSKLDLSAALAMGASRGQYDDIPTLRFDVQAHGEFLEWRTDLEKRLRSGELSPAIEGHLAKYRTLVPTLALIAHLADEGGGAVGREALLRALAFAEYLESHARRIYGAGSEAEAAAANAILGHIRRGDLKDGFSARDVHQRGWSHLTDREQVSSGLDLLADHLFLSENIPQGTPKGGRPRISYVINPRAAR